jgi:nitrate/nitrite transporter NarK
MATTRAGILPAIGRRGAGLVGAAGGLGGFFPPLVLGAVRQATGSFTPGFVLLALFSIVCFVVIFKSGSKPDIKSHLVSHGAAA